MFDYNDYYRARSRSYDAIRLDQQADMQNTLEIIRDSSEGRDRLLDVGCGSGAYGSELGMYWGSVFGVDVSMTQCEVASGRLPVAVASTLSLPFRDCVFDTCTMILMLQQLPPAQRKLALSEVRRVLSPGGVLIVKTCFEEDLRQRLSSEFFPRALEIDLARYPRPDALLDQLQGFTASFVPSAVDVVLDRDRHAEKLLSRRSSNLGMLTESELRDGVSRFLARYEHTPTVRRSVRNTFVVARLER